MSSSIYWRSEWNGATSLILPCETSQRIGLQEYRGLSTNLRAGKRVWPIRWIPMWMVSSYTRFSPKDGYPVRDCRDATHRRLLEFIVPIIHPDKPTRVTIMIGNTIFGALDGERPVDRERVFMDLVLKLVGGIEKSKPTPICLFLFHLYDSQGLLTDEEETDYRTAQELTNYRITSDLELESALISEEEIGEIQAPK